MISYNSKLKRCRKEWTFTSFYQFIKILDTATGTGVLYARLNPLNKLHPVDSVWRTSTHWLLVKIISRTARCQRALFIYFSPPGKSESRAERYTAVWRLVAPARQSGPGEIITWRRSLPGDHLLDKQLRDLRHPLLFIHYNYCKVWIRETTGSAPRRKEEGGGGGFSQNYGRSESERSPYWKWQADETSVGGAARSSHSVLFEARTYCWRGISRIVTVPSHSKI